MASPPPPPSSVSRSSLLARFDKLAYGLAMVPSLLSSPPSDTIDCSHCPKPVPDSMSLEGADVAASPPSPVSVSRPRICLLADENQAKQPRILHFAGGADMAQTSIPFCQASSSPTFPLSQLSTSLPSSFQTLDEESEYEKNLPMTPPHRIFPSSPNFLAPPMAPRKAYKNRAAPLRRHQRRRLQFADDEAFPDHQPPCLSNTHAASMLAARKKSSLSSSIEDKCRGATPLAIADNVVESGDFQRDESNSESPQTPPAARFDSFACGSTPRAPKKPFAGSRSERD